MSYETMPLTYMNIYVGSRFSESINCTDDQGEPITFLSDDDWAGEAQIRDGYGGDLIAAFSADTGSEGRTDPGTVTFDDIGNVTLSLPSTFTETLQPTASALQFQPATLVGDLYLWNTDTPNDRVRITDLRVRIYPEATTS